MRLQHTRLLIVALLVLVAIPVVSSAQTKPSLRRRRPAARVVTIVPIGTNMKVRLNETLSSKDARAGDQFSATVIDPVRFSEATVHGHVRSITQSGRVKGSTTMNLAFDSINTTDNRHAVMHGYITRVYGSSGKADEEGGVKSGGRGSQTLKRAGIGAGAGAIVGAIVGGGKGAGIGLLIGGAGGAGSVAIKGSKELKLESGTEMIVHVTR